MPQREQTVPAAAVQGAERRVVVTIPTNGHGCLPARPAGTACRRSASQAAPRSAPAPPTGRAGPAVAMLWPGRATLRAGGHPPADRSMTPLPDDPRPGAATGMTHAAAARRRVGRRGDDRASAASRRAVLLDGPLPRVVALALAPLVEEGRGGARIGGVGYSSSSSMCSVSWIASYVAFQRSALSQSERSPALPGRKASIMAAT